MAYGKSDSRLTEECAGGRGCGGVAILWHKSLGAMPITGISSDRICAIRLKVDDENGPMLTIIGVYMPCSDKGIECY